MARIGAMAGIGIRTLQRGPGCQGTASSMARLGMGSSRQPISVTPALAVSVEDMDSMVDLRAELESTVLPAVHSAEAVSPVEASTGEEAVAGKGNTDFGL